MVEKSLLTGLLIFLVCGAAFGQLTGVIGTMDATLNPGQSMTFEIDVNAGSQGFNGELNAFIDAGQGLSLSAATITPPLMQCTVSSRGGADFENCLGGVVSIAANSKLHISQTITVKSTLAKKAASEGILGPLANWHIQMIGTALSGFRMRTGTITFGTRRPLIVIEKYPGVVVQQPNASGKATTLVLRNQGNDTGSFSLSDFTGIGTFQITPLAGSLDPGDSVTITLTPAQQATSGEYIQRFIVRKAGSDDQLIIARLEVVQAPTAAPQPEAAYNRFDVAFSGGGAITFKIPVRNIGSGIVAGAFDVPAFIVPPPGPVTINPGESKEFEFGFDPLYLPTPSAGTALEGTLQLIFLNFPSGKGLRPLGGGGTASISITLVVTVPPAATSAVPPSLAPKCPSCFTDTALFIPGVGHVLGSVGQFISDLVVFPRVGFGGPGTSENRTISNVDLYFTPLSSSTSTAKKVTVNALAPPSSAAFGDMVSTVFGANQVGTLQVRSLNFTIDETVGLNANVFNVSNRAGTYGTALPVFISDTAVKGTDKEYLTGLRKDATSHTNIYLQESIGSDITAGIDFYDASGNKIGSTTSSVPAFGAVQLGGATVPNGTVSAAVSVASGNGAVHAYATPVDEASGDTWIVVDWSRIYSYYQSFFLNGANVLIPVAGAAPGANNTFFKTDAAIMNVGGIPASGTLRYFIRGGPTIDKPVNLNPLQTLVLNDITTTFFGVTGGNVGYMTYTPAAGRVAITSRNYTTSAGSAATFGTAVPTIPIATTSGGVTTSGSGISKNGVVRIAGIEDASLATVGAAQPGSFRSNLGLVEVSGQPATVQVTIYFNANADKTSVTQGGSATYTLAPNEFKLIGNIASAVLGANRANFGDLHNITVEFKVTDGGGRVVPFISSIDNGSGDSTFRVQ